MCEKLLTGAVRSSGPVALAPGPGSLCPYSAESGRAGRAGDPRRTLNLCRYLTLCSVQKSEEIKMTKSAPVRPAGAGAAGNRPILTGAAIGRQLVGLWPNSDRGSWNVKMVDGRPSGPRDSVFAASLVDCVWMLLCLPVTGECWGAPGPAHTRSSLRGLCSI